MTPDSPISGLTVEERECVESLEEVYIHLNSEDMDLTPEDKEDFSRCVRCIQDRIMALPTKRRLRVGQV